MTAPAGQIRLGTTLYSLTNEFHGRQYDLEGLIREVAARGLGPGLEVVGFQSFRGFPDLSAETIRWFRDLLDECGLIPSCLGLNADINLRADAPMTVDEAVAYQRRQLEVAAQLGFRIARVQGYILGPDAYEKLLPDAERLDVKMGIEIHAPHHVRDPQILAYREAFDRIGSEHLGFIPDFGATTRAVPPSFIAYLRSKALPEEMIETTLGHWRASTSDYLSVVGACAEDLRAQGATDVQINLLTRLFVMYGKQDVAEWAEIMDRVIHVHGKFYDIGEDGNETAVPYRELLKLFQTEGYAGFISSEWEGHIYNDEDGFDALVRHHRLCRSILNA